MDLSYGNICRKKRQKKADLGLTPFLWRAPDAVAHLVVKLRRAYDSHIFAPRRNFPARPR